MSVHCLVFVGRRPCVFNTPKHYRDTARARCTCCAVRRMAAVYCTAVLTHGLFSYSSAAQQSAPANIHTPESAQVFPAHLTTSVSLGDQPYKPLSVCEGKLFNLPKARCVAECTHATNASSECRTCDPLCGALIHRWKSPTGQILESLKTLTDPPFVFAYNPYDDDMLKMRRTLILEPTLTRVWHETTWKCCRRNGLTVDVISIKP